MAQVQAIPVRRQSRTQQTLDQAVTDALKTIT
jgi:hypothetical protein